MADQLFTPRELGTSIDIGEMAISGCVHLLRCDNRPISIFGTAATSAVHLTAILDLFVTAIAVPLHSISERTHQRLAAIRKKKAAE